MNKLVSVIVPVYNSGKYISRCLDSILSQVYTNIEVVLIDDGSTDNSFEICREYEKNDSRVRVIHQENSGASVARNTGLKNISGEYVMFCDSDDMVSDLWVKHLVDSCDEKTMPVCSYCSQKSKIGQTFDLDIKANESYNKSEYFKFSKVGLAGYICNTIFSAGYIKSNNLLFRCQKEKADYNEDLLFVMEYIKNIDYFVYVGCADYAYLTRNDSLSRRYNPYYFDKYAEKFEIWYSFLNSYNTEELQAMSTSYLYHFICSLISEVSNKDSRKRYKKFKEIVLSETVHKCLKYADCSNEDKRIIKMLKNKNSLGLWLYLELVDIKKSVI